MTHGGIYARAPAAYATETMDSDSLGGRDVKHGRRRRRTYDVGKGAARCPYPLSSFLLHVAQRRATESYRVAVLRHRVVSVGIALSLCAPYAHQVLPRKAQRCDRIVLP